MTPLNPTTRGSGRVAVRAAQDAELLAQKARQDAAAAANVAAYENLPSVEPLRGIRADHLQSSPSFAGAPDTTGTAIKSVTAGSSISWVTWATIGMALVGGLLLWRHFKHKK